ncbi:MAG TPA: ABC transporter ATP-binding protein [Geobacteraceae bacterium]|nr:ABC transporter ATP-binding protein [Geobacteraceae bacterium]
MIANSPLYELSEVSYRYHASIPALDRFSLAIFPGESLAILGANGSGKSTLLQLLDGLIFPASGTITAFNELLTEEKLETDAFRCFFRSRVGFVFQNPDIQLFCPTVFDEVAFGPLQLGLPSGEVTKRVEDVIAMLGISSLKDRTSGQLSGGEKKKVAIASVLSLNPQVLLLDEPTNALDLRTRHWFIDLIGELRKVGKTIITATHELSIVEKISSRVIVLAEDHTIAADGTPAEVVANHEILHKANIVHESDTSKYYHHPDEQAKANNVIPIPLATADRKK